MLTPQERELISAGFDGELTADERREHDALIERSEDARRFRAELEKLDAAIRSLPEHAPPAGLAGRILDQAAPTSATVVPFRRPWRRMQVPLAFAAGLLAAVAVQRWLPVDATPGDVARMSGTLAPSPRAADTRRVDTAGLSGRVTLDAAGDEPTLEFVLEGAEPLAVEVDLDGSGLSFGGFEFMDVQGNRGDGRIELTGGTVRMTGGRAAAARLRLPATGERSEGVVAVVVRARGEVVLEESFAYRADAAPSTSR